LAKGLTQQSTKEAYLCCGIGPQWIWCSYWVEGMMVGYSFKMKVKEKMWN